MKATHIITMVDKPKKTNISGNCLVEAVENPGLVSTPYRVASNQIIVWIWACDIKKVEKTNGFGLTVKN